MSDEVSDSMNLSRMSNSVIINGYHFSLSCYCAMFVQGH